jgi:hypothetical protein
VNIEILVDGEGFSDIALFEFPHGIDAHEIIARGAGLGGFPITEAMLFVEDAEGGSP